MCRFSERCGNIWKPLDKFGGDMGDIRFLRLQDVLGRTGMKRSKLYAMIAKGGFPGPVKVDQCAVWVDREVSDWMAARVSARADGR